MPCLHCCCWCFNFDACCFFVVVTDGKILDGVVLKNRIDCVLLESLLDVSV